MFTLNGFGTTFVGECDYEPDGTYVTTAWIVALWIPLIPLYSARVLSIKSTILSGATYQIIKQPVHWGQARRIWGVFWKQTIAQAWNRLKLEAT